MKRYAHSLLSLGLILLVGLSSCSRQDRPSAPTTLNLAGSWSFQLDEQDRGINELWFEKALKTNISLPGTTDEAGFGEKTIGAAYGRLTRKHRYVGPAWYQKDILIPPEWENKSIFLFLERVLWESRVWIDSRFCDIQDSLGTPHIHRIGRLEPGTHRLTIRVDNRMIHNIGDMGHAYSESMQSIWNGIVGRIELQARDIIHLSRIRTFPKPGKKELGLDIRLANPYDLRGELTITVREKESGATIVQTRSPFSRTDISLNIHLKEPVQTWDEFTPALYTVEVALKAKENSRTYEDSMQTTFGFATVGADSSHVRINDRPVFLRGNLDCIHFPLTGYPAVTKDAWKKIFGVYKNHGLNHVRFHSWCPPDAAFQAADEMGIYIQAEASVWIDGWMALDQTDRPEMRTQGFPEGLGKGDPDADAFIRAEIDRMNDAYGNHPSFVLLCIGNELGSSDFTILGEWIRSAKEKDPRRLYAASTARQVTPFCDYSATHSYPGVGMVRQRLEDHSDWDYEEQYGQTPVPVIAHEIGQWPVYPRWDEIQKYRGVLEARNLVELRKTAAYHGTEKDNIDLQRASGAVSRLLYKDEIESFLRTPGCAGFQLLSMQDYSGQGEALVGWLDSFYEAKGTVRPDAFRRFCSSTVPLIRLPKYIWTQDEPLIFKALVHHFGQRPLTKTRISWKITDDSNRTIQEGEFKPANLPLGSLTEIDALTLSMKDWKVPGRYTIHLRLQETGSENSWGIWVYPETLQELHDRDVLVSSAWDKKTQDILLNGGRVLLLAHEEGPENHTKYAAWRPLYWSASFFPNQRMETLGLFIRSGHPAFAAFPTDYFGDRQWKRICEEAKGFICDDLPADLIPIVQPVSDFHFSHRLAALFECRVGEGKLLVCGFNLSGERKNLPEINQLRHSLLSYMAGKTFSPAAVVSIDHLTRLLAGR